MQTKVTITRKFRVPAERAWAAIEAVGGFEVWFPIFTGCEVEGSGVGAKRRLTLDGGMGEILDVVRSIEPQERRLRHERVESPLPVSSYLGPSRSSPPSTAWPWSCGPSTSNPSRT